MTSGSIAALIAALALGFAEGLGRFYPSRTTWRRLRSMHGRRAVRAMRERLENVSRSRVPRFLAVVLLGLVIGWIASASLLDKRWYEVVMDVLPYLFIGIAVLRTPPITRAMAQRMRDYERDVGEDPDKPLDVDYPEEGGPTAVAL
jgi:hypothetical protein